MECRYRWIPLILLAAPLAILVASQWMSARSRTAEGRTTAIVGTVTTCSVFAYTLVTTLKAVEWLLSIDWLCEIEFSWLDPGGFHIGAALVDTPRAWAWLGAALIILLSFGARLRDRAERIVRFMMVCGAAALLWWLFQIPSGVAMEGPAHPLTEYLLSFTLALALIFLVTAGRGGVRVKGGSIIMLFLLGITWAVVEAEIDFRKLTPGDDAGMPAPIQWPPMVDLVLNHPYAGMAVVGLLAYLALMSQDILAESRTRP